MTHMTSMDDLQLPPSQLPPSQSKSSPAGWGKLLLGTGLGALLTLITTTLLRPSPSSSPVPLASTSDAATHTPVTTITVASTSLQQTLEATGTVTAAELLAILSPTSGLTIQQVLVEEGDQVQQGQVLAILDTAVLQSQLRAAEAEVRVAESKLAELRAGSRREAIERARAAVGSAEAEVIAVESDLQLAEQRVQRNQTLAQEGAIASERLDEVLNQSRNQRSNLAQAQAALQQARQQLAELAAGARPEVIAQAEAELDASQQRVQTLTAQIEDAQVLAPRSGKIAERQARVGEVTSPTSKLFSLIDRQQLELWLEVPETQLSQVRRQQGVWISSDAQPQLRLTGRVQDIDPLVNPESRLATVKVSLPTSNLQPGMFLRGAIITATWQGISLPLEAVLPQPDGQALVYRVNDNPLTINPNPPDSPRPVQAPFTPTQPTTSPNASPSVTAPSATALSVTAQPVELGELLPNGQIEVKRGLRVGDQVVVKGAAYLADGDRVTVVQGE